MSLTIQLPSDTSRMLRRRGVGERVLPPLIQEPPVYRRLWLGVALLVCALYSMLLFRLWAPADGGVDQNAYLVGGRLIAQHFTPRYDLPNPYAYVGNMFVRNDAGSYYPKYPFGLPLIYAVVNWLGGATRGAVGVFLVSPIATVLSMLGMFFLARLVAGSFAAVMAAVLLASSQLTLMLANNPNSHVSCLACVVWGMYALLRWWQAGSWWRGAIAGLLLGYAALIRYSEGLLVLPIAAVCLARLRWSNWRSYLRCAIPALTWAAPVLSLLIFNKMTLGEWTGYDTTNESEFGAAFTWAKFMLTWEQVLRTLYDLGLFFVLPLGVAGLVLLFRRSWRVGVMLLLWVLPGVALYTAYYWSPERGIAYARFFLTFLPPVLVGSAVCFSDGMLGSLRGGGRSCAIAPTLAVGVVVAISAGVSSYRALHGIQQGQAGGMPSLIEEYRSRRSLANTGRVLLTHVPAKSVLFVDEGGFGNSPINYVQALRDWELYSTGAFTVGGGRRGGLGRPGGRGGRVPGGFGGPGGAGGPGGGFRGGPPDGGPGGGGPDGPAVQQTDVPAPVQVSQREYMASLYQNKNQDDLMAEQSRVLDAALQSGRRVFVAASLDRMENFRALLRPLRGYSMVTCQKWRDLPTLDESVPAPAAGARRGRGFGALLGLGGGGPGGGPGGPGGRMEVQDWELMEVKAVK